MANFGISTVQDACVVLQAPTTRQVGVLYLASSDGSVYKLDLSDAVVTPHRTALGVVHHVAKGERPPSPSALNFTFVNDHVRPAVDNTAYTVEVGTTIRFRYTVNGVECGGAFSGFKVTSVMELMRAVGNELHRVYDKVHDMVEVAAARGVELEEDASRNQVAEAERIHQAELRRKNLSAVNPMIRAKKITKGFGAR